jgi:CRISPR-associated protein Cmr6
MPVINKLLITEENIVSFLKWEFVSKIKERLKEIERGMEEVNKRGHRVKGGDPLSEFRYEFLAKQLYEAYSSKEEVSVLLAEAKRLVDEYVEALEELGYVKVMDLNFVALTPLAIGLRNPYTEPLEISISWDPYINLPYIPASSLKGAVASLAWMNNSKLYDFLSKKDEASPIIFLDAYPVEILGKGLLALDITNPHYREVERKISEPESRPRPLRFLVVSRGIAFRIIVCAARRWLTLHRPLDLEGLRSLIRGALSRGIGAKTSIGYGRFKTK